MTVRPPRHVVVGPHRYRVRVSSRSVRAAEGGARSLAGATSHTSLEIAVCPDQAPSQERDTVLHEVLHCVLEQCGRDDEDLVRSLAPGLLALLRGNPKLVRYLTGDA